MQTKTCRQCNTNFTVTDDDLRFYEKISPEFAGKKYLIPSPTLCPDCRQIRRLITRTDTNYCKRKCDFTGKEMLSMFSPESPYKIYDNEAWESDQWNPLDYGRDFDFTRPFFEQFQKLLLDVPLPARNATSCENCDYVLSGGYSKDCYMLYTTIHSERCMYGGWIQYSQDCIDCFDVWECEGCYEVVKGAGCYHCFYGLNIHNCANSYLLEDCIGCKNCFGCVNLNNKNYWIYNQKASKEEYEKIVSTFLYGSITEKNNILTKYNELSFSSPKRFAKIANSEDCTGDYIINSKNIQKSFFVDNSENVKYAISATSSKDNFDTVNCGVGNSERMYESMASGGQAMNLFGCVFVATNVRNIFYSWFCFNGSADLFGCVGLRKKQYCIFNKQYSKEEYEILVGKIIEHMQKSGEWGKFFPMSMSPFGYNESKAQLFYPLTKTEALKFGARWTGEEDTSNYKGPFIVPEEDIQKYDPKKSKEAEEEIKKLLSRVIKCKITGKPFKILAKELSFYIENSIPIPRIHPSERNLIRIRKIYRCKLYSRQCMCQEPNHDHPNQCPVEFQTTYAPDRPKKVYCETCYQKSVI